MTCKLKAMKTKQKQKKKKTYIETSNQPNENQIFTTTNDNNKIEEFTICSYHSTYDYRCLHILFVCFVSRFFFAVHKSQISTKSSIVLYASHHE